MKKQYTVKCFVAVLFLLIFFQVEGKTEAFTIRHYDVKIYLKPDGSLNVTETIDLRFHEGRRGIMRNIPVVYQDAGPVLGKGNRAIRPLGPQSYQIILEDIEVEGHPFVYYREGHNKIIRIGNPNKTLRGNQRYVISYTVWGGLNEFEETVEWPWNIIGNEWDVPIERVTFEVVAEAPLAFSEQDLVVVTGRRGMTGREVRLEISNNRIIGESTRPLRPYEGISIVTRHPKSSFRNIHTPIDKLASKFWVENHEYSFELARPGFVRVTEVLDLRFKEPTNSIERLVANSDLKPAQQTPLFPYLSSLEVSSGNSTMEASWNRKDDFTRVVIKAPQGSPFLGEQKIKLEYDIWGVGENAETIDLFRLIPSLFSPSEPVNKLSIQNPHNSFTSFSFFLGGRSQTSLSSAESFQLQFEYPEVRPEYGLLQVTTNSGIYEINEQPIQVYGRHYVVADMDVHVNITKRQLVEISREYEVANSYPEPSTYFEPVFPTRFKVGSDFFHSKSKPASWNLLDRKLKALTKMDAHEGSFKGIGRGYKRLKRDSRLFTEGEWSNSDHIKYSGLFTKNRQKGEDQVKIPIVSKATDPIKNFNIRVRGVELKSRDLVRASLQIGDKIVLPLEFKDGDWVNPQALTILAGESVVLDMSGPVGFAGRLGLGDTLYLFLINNMPIWFIGLIGGLLYFLWNRIGRNEKEAVVVRFYPPEKITSAEAGLLWDDKLHRKDLVSLVYYWAAQGLLEIEEIGEGNKMDYKFSKLKELPNEARLYEKTFFKGLFFKKEVKLSELKHRFAGTMRLAHKDLMDHSKRNDFYVPGSRGFGCGLLSLGVIILLIGFFGLGLALFTGHWSYAVAPLSIGILMVVFGRMMPKKGPFGFKKYQKLLGFREFIRTAEIDRIKTLYKENPGYFDKTIAYAIVFGLGKQWAEKFEGLMTEPPSWYKTERTGSDFSTIYFTNELINSMHRMNYNMSLPSASSSGGGSSWSGGGGSGFGGGSFGSGGGFGGGGGSSW